MPDTELLANEIYNAEKTVAPIQPITNMYPDISAGEAYEIQLEYVKKRIEQGAEVKGKKIGLTSQAMQDMLGVDQPDYGHIFDDMIYNEGEKIDTEKFIKPRIEFEIAFVLKEDIDADNINSDNVADYIDYALPAAELIDSRICDWKIKFEDTVSDNGSSAGAVLGAKRLKLADIDLPAERMEIFKNGIKIDEGYGNAVLGDPLEAVVWLAKSLHAYDITLKKGEVVLAGSLTKAMDVAAGDIFEAHFENLGSVKVEF
ncbi:2-keto-4-pentenoate hydratase [Salinicoccus sp. Marseille-QA3877]